MTLSAELEINRAVRRILVKHWIDLGRVSVHTTRGRVAVYGLLQHIEGRMDPLTGPVLDAMFYEIRRIPGVVIVRGHLDNWTNDGGRWRPLESGSRQAEADPTRGDTSSPSHAAGD